MGDRVNIVVTTDHRQGVVLYSHWGGGRMPRSIAKFISKTGRLDSDYFTRNLMCSIIADSLSDPETNKSGFDLDSVDNKLQLLEVFQDELCFGIGLNLAGDREYPVIVINPETQSLWLVDDQEIMTTEECVSRALRNKEISFQDLTKNEIHYWSDLEKLFKTEEIVVSL